MTQAERAANLKKFRDRGETPGGYRASISVVACRRSHRSVQVRLCPGRTAGLG